MNPRFLPLLGAAWLGGCAPMTTLGPPRTDVCRPQIEAEVAGRFGARVTRIDWQFNYEGTPQIGRSVLAGSANQAVVYTDTCDGYHVFDVLTDYATCEHLAHYGEPPRYVRYRTSGGGCKPG